MWIKVDDHYDEHPKMAAASPLGQSMWLAGLAYCNRNLTDGFIPWSVARSLLTWEFLEPEDEYGKRRVMTISVTSGMTGEDVDCEYVALLLVGAGLWTECPGGYRIHDYDQYQPTKAQVQAEREAKAAAGRAGGQATAKSRAKRRARAPAIALAKAPAVAPDETVAVAEPQPVPVPVPVPVPENVNGYISPTGSVPRARLSEPSKPGGNEG